MLKGKQLGAIVFFCQDLERTEQFYKDVLGLDVVRMSGEEGEMLNVEMANCVLVFFAGEDRPGRSPIPVFNVAGDDINALVDKLIAARVEIVAPVQHAPDGGLTADFQDPDGHVLSLYHPPQ